MATTNTTMAARLMGWRISAEPRTGWRAQDVPTPHRPPAYPVGMRRSLPLIAAIFALLTAGCVKYETTINVNDDGSGFLEMVVAIDAEAVSDLSSMFGEDLGGGELEDAGAVPGRDELCADTRLDPAGIQQRRRQARSFDLEHDIAKTRPARAKGQDAVFVRSGMVRRGRDTEGHEVGGIAFLCSSNG